MKGKYHPLFTRAPFCDASEHSRKNVLIVCNFPFHRLYLEGFMPTSVSLISGNVGRRLIKLLHGINFIVIRITVHLWFGSLLLRVSYMKKQSPITKYLPEKLLYDFICQFISVYVCIYMFCWISENVDLLGTPKVKSGITVVISDPHLGKFKNPACSSVWTKTEQQSKDHLQEGLRNGK